VTPTGCHGCDIGERATHAVFGEGATDAEVMLVGEQPGNREDLEGLPFVGPAGKLQDEALIEAGIDRSRVYITNIVKHFNSTTRGKIRIHKKSNADESQPVVRGSRPRSLALRPKSSCAWEQPPLRRSSRRIFA
jgi:uracil-DNA glycosylase